ncbi:NADH-quinone oxidoreductase subunit J [bacterium]|nr:NADH-quinone oxidoreductase subunit J [bacterium]
MNLLFYISALVAILATGMVVTRKNIVHALLYLVVSLLAISLVFFVIGAPFIAALEVIVYAGAIMVLFLFAIMVLNLGKETTEQEKQWLSPAAWVGPALLALILAIEIVFLITQGQPAASVGLVVDPKTVAIALFGPYVLGVEIASFLLLAGLVGAYHLGRKDTPAAQCNCEGDRS